MTETQCNTCDHPFEHCQDEQFACLMRYDCLAWSQNWMMELAEIMQEDMRYKLNLNARQEQMFFELLNAH